MHTGLSLAEGYSFSLTNNERLSFITYNKSSLRCFADDKKKKPSPTGVALNQPVPSSPVSLYELEFIFNAILLKLLSRIW